MNFQFLREHPAELSRYLPAFLRHDAHFKALLSSCSAEHERLRMLLQDVVKQFFVETATWGLTSWEQVLALEARAKDGYEARRKRILLKLQARQISTVSFMERLASAYFPQGAKVQIEEQNERYAFRLISTAISSDYSGLLEALEEYKPAHLALALDYLIEREAQIHVAGYITEYEVTDIQSGDDVSYEIDDTPLYAAGFVDGLEIIEIGSV